MRTNRPRILAAGFLLAAGACGCAAIGPASRGGPGGGVPRFRAEEYEAHWRFLADDRCEGRAPGTRGGDLAAFYIATQFRAAGLRPAAPGKDFFQEVPLQGNLTRQDSVRFHLASTTGGEGTGNGVDLAPVEEVVVTSELTGERVEVQDDLLFVGYGIEAPEYDWDDYKGTDVAGRILVMLVNDPDFKKTGFGSESLTYYGRWTYKEEIARARGARGLVLLHTDESAGYGFEVVQSSNTVERMSIRGAIRRPLALKAWVSRPAIDRALAPVGTSYEELEAAAESRDFRPMPLGLRLRASLEQDTRTLTSPNVVGILPGGDLAGEAVLFLAHYDHLGIGREMDGDRIYNGAVDNASGTAALICLARAFAAAPRPPRRTLVFLATTAEEKGLLGSGYYAAHPVLPLDNTVVALNKDCCGFSGRHDALSAFPARYTDAVPVLEEIAGEMGLRYDPGGPDRNGGAFRVDAFPFCARAVVGLSIGIGGRNLSLTEEERKAFEKSVGPWYHRPNDEVRPEYRLDGVLQELEALYRIGRRYAAGAPAPRLLEGHPYDPAIRMRAP